MPTALHHQRTVGGTRWCPAPIPDRFEHVHQGVIDHSGETLSIRKQIRRLSAYVMLELRAQVW